MRLCTLFFALIFLFASTLSAQPRAGQPTTQPTRQIVTGVVLLNDRTPVDFKVLLSALKTDWSIKVDSMNQAEKTLVVYTGDVTIMLANMDYPAPRNDIQGAAEAAWMWQTATQEAPKHQSQVIISVIGGTGRSLALYKLFTRAAAATLDNTRSCGVYMTNQYVLQSKAFYLQAARNMSETSLPVYCWVFFGMLQQGGLNSGYTYGLSEFGLTDLEIEKSKHTLQEVHAVLYDAVNESLLHQKRWQDGSVLETLEGDKITLKQGKSAFLEGQTLKVAY